jgi:hypothetical protein
MHAKFIINLIILGQIWQPRNMALPEANGRFSTGSNGV